MKIHEVRNLSTEALEAKLNDTREELMKLRFQLTSGELSDFTRLRQTRRIIARLATVLNERQRNPESEENHE
ncbi:MAG: 50S ribosomal protein L29 [Anaerolineales bacterium]|jgi:large subunit ribosomal protein L29|nr:50S ribosomal protein L29 [Anaerolineae bacterium]PWB52105.1 MAG: 50S ribosomal protein L29 [Anaerolineales bacterium]